MLLLGVKDNPLTITQTNDIIDRVNQGNFMIDYIIRWI